MIVAPCPRCDSPVTVPPARPSAQVRCPRCQEEYALSELFDALPPPLELLDPGDALDADDADFQPAWGGAAYGAAVGYAGGDDSDEGGVATAESPAGEAFSFDEAPAPHKVQPASPAAVKTGPRRRRKQRNPLIQIGLIVVGGVVGIVLAQVIMWWGFMPWIPAEQRDFATIGKSIAPYAPWLVPEDVRALAEKDNEDGNNPNGGNNRNGGGNNGGGNNGRGNDGSPGGGFNVPPVDDSASRPRGDTDSDPFDLNGGDATDSDGTVVGGSDGAPDGGDPLIGDTDINLSIDGDDLGDFTPKDPTPGTDLDGLTIDPSDIPDVDDPLGLPDDPLGLPDDPLGTLDDPPAPIKAGFKPNRLRSGAELKEAIESLKDRIEEFESAEKPTSQLGARLYSDVASLAETMARLDLSDAEVSGQAEAAGEVIADVANRADDLVRLTPWWLGKQDRESDGVLVVGEVLSVTRLNGPYVESRIELAGSSSKRLVRVVGWLDPGGGYKPGAKVMILGAVVSEPAEELLDYVGSEEEIIVGGAVKLLEPAPEESE